MDEPILKRTRAKTPVFAVGQLEGRRNPYDATQILADHYRALLPMRTTTPFDELPVPKSPRKTIRKMKRQGSLRNLMKQHSRASSISDSETLVGSESPNSPLTPTYPHFDLKKSSFFDESEKYHVTKKDDEVSSSFDNDIALKICMDLLTNELATAACRQHPLESGDRSSGLQILLMIEAYETVQQHLRQKLYKLHVMDERENHVHDVEQILEYWLQILYSVYERSHEAGIKGREEDFPQPLQLAPNKAAFSKQGCHEAMKFTFPSVGIRELHHDAVSRNVF